MFQVVAFTAKVRGHTSMTYMLPYTDASQLEQTVPEFLKMFEFLSEVPCVSGTNHFAANHPITAKLFMSKLLCVTVCQPVVSDPDSTPQIDGRPSSFPLLWPKVVLFFCVLLSSSLSPRFVSDLWGSVSW